MSGDSFKVSGSSPGRDLDVIRPDFRLRDAGSFWLCEAVHQAALEHLKEHTSDEAVWWGGAVAVEARYLVPLALALRDNGYVVDVASRPGTVVRLQPHSPPHSNDADEDRRAPVGPTSTSGVGELVEFMDEIGLYWRCDCGCAGWNTHAVPGFCLNCGKAI
jgi:hypothetical protein